MPNPYDIALRERAVAAYEAGEGSYAEVADVFLLGQRTLERWVARSRATGSPAAFPKSGGRRSPVNVIVLRAVATAHPDRTVSELRREYNRRVPAPERVSRSSLLRALHREAFVFKKNGRDRRSKIVLMSPRVGRPSMPASAG